MRDPTLMIVGGLRDAGYDTVMNLDLVLPDRINVFYDFLHAADISMFKKLHRQGIRYGLVGTEILSGETLNGITNAGARERIRSIGEVAPGAEFYWIMHEPSRPTYESLARDTPCLYLPLGYSSLIDELDYIPWDERDIDFLFFGRRTPHRMSIMEALRKRGFIVENLSGFPTFLRNSIIERTRINLSISHYRDWTQPSVGRIVYLVSNNCPLVVERTENGKPYEDYAVAVDSDSFVDECERIISSEPYWDIAEKNYQKIKKDLFMGQIMKNLVKQIAGE